MRGTLEEIVAHKRERYSRLRGMPGYEPGMAYGRAIGTIAHNGLQRIGFRHALERKIEARQPALIAEIKRASPSRGLIREDFEPAVLAREYANGGATCLSVLTEPKWFQGAAEHLIEARNAADLLPVLRKDFIVDSAQISEARLYGADCILLIVAALSDEELKWFSKIANALGMDVLVEAHDEAELDRALVVDGAIIGINNRDLKTLKVHPLRALDLAKRVPEGRIVVAESGLSTHDDLKRYMDAGVFCFLVGEALMRENDVEAATRRLLTGA